MSGSEKFPFNEQLYESRLAYFKREFDRTGYDYTPKRFLEYCAKYSMVTVIKKGLFLFSGCGTGKTSRMAFMSRTMGIKMITALALYEAFKNYGVDYANDLSLVNLKRRYDVYPDHAEDLIIDELGTEPPTCLIFGTPAYPLADIIEQRYIMFTRHQALTHFTSNKSIEEIKQVYGERVYSRIHEMCHQLNMNGIDRRLTK
jgi:DNA replication protein DnaC